MDKKYPRTRITSEVYRRDSQLVARRWVVALVASPRMEQSIFVGAYETLEAAYAEAEWQMRIVWEVDQ